MGQCEVNYSRVICIREIMISWLELHLFYQNLSCNLVQNRLILRSITQLQPNYVWCSKCRIWNSDVRLTQITCCPLIARSKSFWESRNPDGQWPTIRDSVNNDIVVDSGGTKITGDQGQILLEEKRLGDCLPYI